MSFSNNNNNKGILLYDFFRGNSSISLKDNQLYNISSGILTNVFNRTEISLINKRGSLKNENIFEIARCIELHISKNQKDINIILFDEKNYEHNKDQIFIKIEGLDLKNFSIQTGNLIGHIIKDKHEINISSRFGNRFLKYIIADADGFLNIDDLGGSDKIESIHWLLQFMWTIKLKKAFRLGVPKVYLKQTSIGSKVKGSIDVEYFEINKGIGRFKSISRNHSRISDQNSLILRTFDFINSDFITGELFTIKQAFNEACEGTRKINSEVLKAKSFSNPFYSDYNELLELSKIIIQNGCIDFGSESSFNGFLFDVSMLFEYFIRKLLLRNGFTLHTKNEKNLTIPTGIKNMERNLYPDIIAEIDNKTFLFDVKYKRFNNEYGVNREDLFQIYTYFSQICNTNIVDYFGFIYPTNDNNKQTINIERVTVLGKECTFIIAFLYIPADSECFAESFKNSISDFIHQFKNIN